MTDPRDETRTAGRGLLSITSAKIYFVLTSYAVQICLPRLFGSAKALGEYATAMNLASILNNVLIAATVQSVSKHVSEDEGRAPGWIFFRQARDGLSGRASQVRSPDRGGRNQVLATSRRLRAGHGAACPERWGEGS